MHDTKNKIDFLTMVEKIRWNSLRNLFRFEKSSHKSLPCSCYTLMVLIHPQRKFILIIYQLCSDWNNELREKIIWNKITVNVILIHLFSSAFNYVRLSFIFFSNENDAFSINLKKTDSIFNKSESEWAMLHNFETDDVAWRLICKKKN